MNGCAHTHYCLECRTPFNCWNPECTTLGWWICGACVWSAGKLIRAAAREVHGSVDQGIDQDFPKVQVGVGVPAEPPSKRVHHPRRYRLNRSLGRIVKGRLVK